MTRETITIEFNFDSLLGEFWVATFENYDGPESPLGNGSTPEEALAALLYMAGYPDAD